MTATTLATALFLAVGLPQQAANDPDPGRLMEAARTVIEAAGICALVTLDDEGRPRARAMDPFPPEGDLHVWMGTHRRTRKVADLRADPRATVYCYDPGGIAYVTLMGRVRIVDDPEEKAARFKPEWRDFYEDEHRDPDYLLLELVPDRLEMMSLEHGIAADPKGWRPAILELPLAEQPR